MLVEQLEPEDLIKYGLIPEFVGRLPVVGTLHELDKPALIQILTQPRNAITRQYQRLFEYENVKLRFTDDALEAIAEAALARKIGARGLRMIIEDIMLDLMYTLPGQKKIRECVDHARGGRVEGEADHGHRKGRLDEFGLRAKARCGLSRTVVNLMTNNPMS